MEPSSCTRRCRVAGGRGRPDRRGGTGWYPPLHDSIPNRETSLRHAKNDECPHFRSGARTRGGEQRERGDQAEEEREAAGVAALRRLARDGREERDGGRKQQRGKRRDRGGGAERGGH